MKVTYTAPNRAHHVAFASTMLQAGCLHKFVTGISRFSPRFESNEFSSHIIRADHLQNVYLASLKWKMPRAVSSELAYVSKIWLDYFSTKAACESDVFLCYSGSGLRTISHAKKRGVRCVVEAVNSHVLVQQALLSDESKKLKIEPPQFHQREVRRRVAEYNLADAVLCPSHFVKSSFVAQGFPAEKIFVVPYGFYPPAPARVVGKKDDRFRVLYVGQIDVRKGLRYLIQAFDRLRHPKKELLLVGPRTQTSGIDDLQIPNNVRFYGVAKGEELARLYQSATVFVQPSIEEGLSLVLAEALSFGLPIIATVNTGAVDLFTDAREGFIVPIQDERIIAEKLQQLAEDANLRLAMSDKAKERAGLIGGWKSTGENLLKALHSISEKHE